MQGSPYLHSFLGLLQGQAEDAHVELCIRHVQEALRGGRSLLDLRTSTVAAQSMYQPQLC